MTVEVGGVILTLGGAPDRDHSISNISSPSRLSVLLILILIHELLLGGMNSSD